MLAIPDTHQRILSTKAAQPLAGANQRWLAPTLSLTLKSAERAVCRVSICRRWFAEPADAAGAGSQVELVERAARGI